jgi:hypothetical protein
LKVYYRSGGTAPKQSSHEKGVGILPPRQLTKQYKYHRFCQELAAIGFGPDRYEDEMMEERDIQYFKRLSMHLAGDNTEAYNNFQASIEVESVRPELT